VINESVAGDTTFPGIPDDRFELISSERLSVVPDALLSVFVRKPDQRQQAVDEDH
jgi:hypothetical protein